MIENSKENANLTLLSNFGRIEEESKKKRTNIIM